MKTGFGQISLADAQMFSWWVFHKTGENLHPNAIINAAMNSPVQMLEDYRSKLWGSLIKHFNVEVITMGMKMNLSGIEGDKVLGYR